MYLPMENALMAWWMGKSIVDMCGLDLLTSGFGTLTFVRGFAALVGKMMMMMMTLVI